MVRGASQSAPRYNALSPTIAARNTGPATAVYRGRSNRPNTQVGRLRVQNSSSGNGPLKASHSSPASPSPAAQVAPTRTVGAAFNWATNTDTLPADFEGATAA